MKTVFGVLSAVLVMLSAQVASADELTFVGSDGTRSAEVTFTSSGGNLIITLTNTSAADCLVPTDVLTAVFFSAPTTLTPVSAAVALGSVYNFASVTNVGGEWAYNSNGISASGFGLFGGDDRFDTSSNLQGPDSPAGVQFGIVSAGDIAGTGNSGLLGPSGDQGLIKNSVTFVLSGWDGSLADITGIYFQYGTGLNEPGFPGEQTPEPAGMVLLGIGAAGLLVARRRKNTAA